MDTVEKLSKASMLIARNRGGGQTTILRSLSESDQYEPRKMWCVFPRNEMGRNQGINKDDILTWFDMDLVSMGQKRALFFDNSTLLSLFHDAKTDIETLQVENTKLKDLKPKIKEYESQFSLFNKTIRSLEFTNEEKDIRIRFLSKRIDLEIAKRENSDKLLKSQRVTMVCLFIGLILVQILRAIF